MSDSEYDRLRAVSPEYRQRMCEHYQCRCLHAAELAAIAERTGRVRYLADATEVHHQKVVCRVVQELSGAIP